jgi:hypothetical protein
MIELKVTFRQGWRYLRNLGCLKTEYSGAATASIIYSIISTSVLSALPISTKQSPCQHVSYIIESFHRDKFQQNILGLAAASTT